VIQSVTNNPDLTIDPDDDNNNLELYEAPVRTPVKPHFTDVACLANTWCQHYLETAQRGVIVDNKQQDLAYPFPPPQYEHFNPVFYPVPWDNNPVPEYLQDELPQGHHEGNVDKPQNEAGSSTHTDDTTPEPRGNSPPWHHLPGGFYEWYTRPGRFKDEEQPKDEDTPERRNNEDIDMDYLVTRTHRYKRRA
jgi:hypothetical protein